MSNVMHYEPDDDLKIDDLMLLRKMANRPMEENFRKITTDLVELKKSQVVSDKDFAELMTIICSSYVGFLVRKYVHKRLNGILGLWGLT